MRFEPVAIWSKVLGRDTFIEVKFRDTKQEGDNVYVYACMSYSKEPKTEDCYVDVYAYSVFTTLDANKYYSITNNFSQNELEEFKKAIIKEIYEDDEDFAGESNEYYYEGEYYDSLFGEDE